MDIYYCLLLLSRRSVLSISALFMLLVFKYYTVYYALDYHSDMKWRWSQCTYAYKIIKRTTNIASYPVGAMNEPVETVPGKISITLGLHLIVCRHNNIKRIKI